MTLDEIVKRTKRPLKPGVFGSANFLGHNEDGTPITRLRLDRWWDVTLTIDQVSRRPADDRYRPLVCIGMNPSDADAAGDDQTIDKMCTFARREAANGLVMVNADHRISTDPKGLASILVPYGSTEENWTAVDSALCENGVAFVAAWGKRPPGISRESWQDRVRKLRDIARDVGRDLVCFGTNQDGTPKHPLYLAASTPLVPYRWSGM